MAKVYVLTEADVILLREIAHTERTRRRSGSHVPVPDDGPPSPEVYIARTPASGIPALTEAVGTSTADQPGYASCCIYRIVGEEETARIHQIGSLARVVYNLSSERVGGNRWVTVKRDSYGKWVIGDGLSPRPADDDTGTGTGLSPTLNPVPYPDTGTGTNVELTGGPGGVYYPCSAVSIEETDVFCEAGGVTILHTHGGLGTGTGTGTDVPPTVASQHYLNLYKRTVFLAVNPATGCLEKSFLPWQYVRTVSCCEPECAAPDTGTGPSTPAETCCVNGSLYERVGYTLSGPTLPFCGSCQVSGYLYQTTPPDGLIWTNSSGGSTCGGQVLLDLTLYCSGTSWRASGRLRRYQPGVFDATQSFDVALSTFSSSTIFGTISVSSCINAMTLVITLPCYSYNCVDGVCTEVPGNGGTYATVEECEVACSTPGTIDTTCCPANLLPETLTVTVTNKTGDHACLPDTFDIVWDGSKWIYDPAGGWAPGCGGDKGAFYIQCLFLGWSCTNTTPNLATTSSCDPFIATWTGANIPVVGSGTCDITITV